MSKQQYELIKIAREYETFVYGLPLRDQEILNHLHSINGDY